MTSTTDLPLPQTSSPTILCVDSNDRMLQVLANILAGLPVNYVTTLYPSEAIEQARRLHPQLLILDGQLPDGWEVLRAIRAATQPTPPQVMILSANEAGFEQMLAANVAGAAAYLQKPFEAEAARLAISRLLDLPLIGKTSHG